MNTVTVNQIAGILRAFAPIVVGLFVKWGLPDTAAGPFVDWAIMILAGFLAGVWSWFSNRPSKVAVQLASTPGIKVEVDHTASEDVKSVAKDPNIPNVVLKTQ